MTDVLSVQQYDNETRAVLNDALKSLLSHYGDPFGLVAGGFGLNIDPVELLQSSPGLRETLLAGGHLKKGNLSEFNAGILSSLIYMLIPVLVRASSGDDFANKQIRAIHKMLEPDGGELPITAIDALLEKHHARPALARGWAIRGLMGRLSWGVKPSQDGVNVLKGRINLNPAEQGHKTYWPEYGSICSPYEVARAHWPKRGAPTLQSLAIKVYQKLLEREGLFISQSRLETDLQELQEWDNAHTEENKRCRQIHIFNAGGESLYLPWPPYSAGWKQSGHWRSGLNDAERNNSEI